MRRDKNSKSFPSRSITAPAATEVGWHGESGKDNVLAIMGRKGTLPVTIHLLPPLRSVATARRLAQDEREDARVAPRPLHRRKPQL